MKHSPALTIFYDSQCPLCVSEMKHLKARDKSNLIAFVDLNQAGFVEENPDIDVDAAMRVLHARTGEGKILLGLDVTHRAWSLVGLGFLTAPLRWPVLRNVSDMGYRFFAKNRYGISRVLTGKARLESCEVCRRI